MKRQGKVVDLPTFAESQKFIAINNLFIYSFIYLFICLFVYLFVYLFIAIKNLFNLLNLQKSLRRVKEVWNRER